MSECDELALNGDVIIYKSRTNLERSDLVGIVVGFQVDERVFVLWVNQKGGMEVVEHHRAALTVVSRHTEVKT